MGRQRKDEESQATNGSRSRGKEAPARSRVIVVVARVGLALIVCGSLVALNLSDLVFTDITWGAIVVAVDLLALLIIPALARGRRRSWLLLTLGYAAVGAMLTPICFYGWMGTGHGGQWSGSILQWVAIPLSLPGLCSIMLEWLADLLWLDPVVMGGALGYGVIGLLIAVFLRAISVLD